MLSLNIPAATGFLPQEFEIEVWICADVNSNGIPEADFVCFSLERMKKYLEDWVRAGYDDPTECIIEYRPTVFENHPVEFIDVYNNGMHRYVLSKGQLRI